MDSHKKLLLANKAWVEDKLSASPEFFTNLAKDQKPEFLWIGCADSRVPAEEVTGTQPGELFVHRNVANLVVHTDFNMLSVLQYAVEVLQVKHVIVCGHYGCGGVQNAMTNRHLGLINKWLRHIKDVYRMHERELDTIVDPTKRFDRMVELNVLEQVTNLAQTSIIQRSWATRQAPIIHGWVYDLRTGQLKELAEMGHESHIDAIYKYDFGDAIKSTEEI
jgi:carbonic anhydrase